jgi:hypothetical protein
MENCEPDRIQTLYLTRQRVSNPIGGPEKEVQISGIYTFTIQLAFGP